MLQTQHHRVIILCRGHFVGRVWPEDPPGDPLPVERCAPETMHDAHAASSGVFQERLKGGAGHIAAHPELANAEMLEHGPPSAEVVLMAMGAGDDVEWFQPAIPQ